MGVWQRTREYFNTLATAWDEFWFTPTDPATLSLIRVFTGAMLFYTHLIWSWDLIAFFGPNGWLPLEAIRPVSDPYSWTFFNLIGSHWLLWTVHLASLLIFFCLMVGLFSRTMAVLAFITAISYATRVTPGAFWGLDKINCMLAMYLMLGPCGARYSLDRLWQLQKGFAPEAAPSIAANVAIRLIQIHLCIIYLFSGLGKLQGDFWWNGAAVWYSIANQEYQSLDLTWLANYPAIMDLLTHATVFFEVFYCCLIWPRLTRPWMLLGAVGIHGFIALGLGMMTFGLVMLIANLAFISPATVRRWVDPLARRISLAVVGDGTGQGTREPARA
ncbi:MAG: HTTM domain-containing protein [Pirellulales bacterium]